MQQMTQALQGVTGGFRDLFTYFFSAHKNEQPRKDVLEFIDRCHGPYSLTRRGDEDYVFNCFAIPAASNSASGIEQPQHHQGYKPLRHQPKIAPEIRSEIESGVY